jgi:hypothetical protein
MWKKYNANPLGKQVGDCTVRAISKVTQQSWEDAYTGMSVYGFMLCDMPSANCVWGAYLKSNGFARHIIPDTCPDCYTVADFCADHPTGTYLLALSGHVVAVENGDYFDSFNSGGEIVIYYWQRKDDR